MIKELVVVKSGRNGTLFEDGVQIPYSEMRGLYKKGEKVLVFFSDEDSGGEQGQDEETECERRISAKIYNYLRDTALFKPGDRVEGIVYEIKPEMGAFFAVQDRYHGLIPLNEMYREVQVGKRMQARVTKVTDGKLRLSIRKPAKDQIDEDVAVVLAALEKGGGILYLSDNTPPEVIRRKLNLSKKAFKRAVGRLLSLGKIQLDDDAVLTVHRTTEK